MIDTTTAEQIERGSLYLKADYEQHSGQYVKALKTYHLLFSLDAPAYAYDGYLRLLDQTNQSSKIVELIDKTKDAFKDNVEIQLIYAQSLINTNQDKQARKLLEELKSKHPENEQIVFYLTSLHEKTNNYPKAIEDLNEFIAKNPNKDNNSFLYFLKAKLHLKLGELQKSLDSINKSLKIYPKFDQGILFKALLFEQTQQIDQAIKTYQEYSKIIRVNETIIKQLVHLLFSQERFAEAVKELKKIESNQFEYYFDLALLEWKAKKYKEAIASVEKAIEKKPDFMKAKILQLQILMSQKKYDTILKKSKKWLSESCDSHLIHMLITLPQEEIDSKKIIALLKEIEYKNSKLKKKDTKIPLALADLFLSTQQYKKAIEYYDKVFKLTNKEELRAKIRFQKSFIYFSRNKKKKAKQELEKALKQKVVYPPAYNLMASILSESKSIKKLDTALNYINKALEYDPKSSDFLDTKEQILATKKRSKLSLHRRRRLARPRKSRRLHSKKVAYK